MTSSDATANPLTSNATREPWTARLFERFNAMYGAKFSEQWSGVDAIVMHDTWERALQDLSALEIKRGLENCLTRPWPPTLPEFRNLCRPIIEPEAAFHQTCKLLAQRAEGRDVWPHPAWYWAAQDVGTFEMLNATWPQIKGRWTDALQRQMALGTWEPVPPRPLELPAPPVNAERVAYFRAEIAKLLAGKRFGPEPKAKPKMVVTEQW